MADFRIHPAIGIARVGNSEEYVIAPETMAGSPAPHDPKMMGGLPIRAGTEKDFVGSGDLRDGNGALKRHAARFRIFHYETVTEETWPRGDGSEITVGARVGERVVKDIIWTVHVANKKANTFVLVEDGKHQGLDSYDKRLPEIRNPDPDKPDAPQPPESERIAILNVPARVKKLTIDPGPRTISGAGTPQVRFDRQTIASFYDASKSGVTSLPNYPKSFPADSFPPLDAPAGPIDTLGELVTDAGGRLLVLGGYGRAVGWKWNGSAPIDADVNNNQWFDDTSDGPVSATVVFDDGSHQEVAGAWVVTADPSFAPQILNVVSCWDDIYDCWVRLLGLAPDIYDDAKGGYQPSYKPSFDDQLSPIFQSASLQRWTVNLDQKGISAHKRLATIVAADDPATTELAGLVPIFRNPFQAVHSDTTLMPLHLGDGYESFLTLRKTQYFFLQRWNAGRGNFKPGPGAALGPGEYLDKATLVNCLGGRFSPGIDLTFVVREPAIYVQPWRNAGVGPFRVRAKRLNYDPDSSTGQPLLTCGYVPRHVESEGLEPGDMTKFMAIPWHTDYNSCATHPPSPNPAGNRKVFWSWPAQRPVAVYSATDVTVVPQSDHSPAVAVLAQQRWSLRGDGTDSPKAENWGRYQVRREILDNWHRIGTIMQAPAITTAGAELMPPDWYLEVESQLVDTGLTPVVPFPNYATEIDEGHAASLDPRDLFFKLLNVSVYPAVVDDARAYVDYLLKWAEDFSNDPAKPIDQAFFRYTEQAFQDRLDLIYQELVDEAADSDPMATDQYFRTHDDVVMRIIQMAPFNLTDGSWLRNIGKTGPIDEVRALLYSVSMDELGDGDVSKNHCNIYRDLCHSVGYYPPPIEAREFAFDPQFLDSAFQLPAFELAISQFTEDYYPEILGMTLQLEWEVVELKSTRDLFTYFGINPHFYVMHIGIDNAVNGHGRRAADAVRLYLQNVRMEGGEEAVQAAWRRIWNGFVAFGNYGDLGQDMKKLVIHKPTWRERVIQMIARKAEFGSRNHQQHMVGPSRIDDWFADPSGFLDALLAHDWITPGDWTNSRLRALMDFETGPMFRVFTDDEIALWANYTASLTAPEPPAPPPSVEAPRAMAALIAQLRPVQRGIAGHQTNVLADPEGNVHTLAWWFEQPTLSFMQALASPVNDIIVPGKPDQSRFFMELIAPIGPMGSVFNLPAAPPNTGTCRDVVHFWISKGCPLPQAETLTLRLSTPPAKRERHPTGRIYGMGTIH
jgi:hypothetical protein